jgi:hypothetical protein
MRTYLSSATTDLNEHRGAVYEALGLLSYHEGVTFEVVRAEDQVASGQAPLSLLLDEVHKADLFICLVGWRYGYVPENQTKSILELEYEVAKNDGIPILCFIADERFPVPAGLVETGAHAVSLRRFKERLAREQVVRRFGSPDELAKEVTLSVSHLMRRRMADLSQDVLDRPVLQEQVDILKSEREQHLAVIEELRRHLAGLVPAAPIWRSRNFELDGSLCFCLLPFQDQFMRVYEEGVLPAAEAAGLRGVHAGQIFDNREIMEDIWESICRARVVVADVSDRNPNVFYELGICHTLGKEVIVVTQRSEDVPFDIRHRRFIQYHPEKMASLKDRLLRTIQRILLRTDDEPRSDVA